MTTPITPAPTMSAPGIPPTAKPVSTISAATIPAASGMRYVIGIDIGTTNTKAVAFTQDGDLLASASQTYPAISPLPDYHELDPAVLFDAVIGVLKEVLSKTAGSGASLPQEEHLSPKGAGALLAGIGFSCAMHSLILVDEQGKPLTNAITWADLRSKDYAAALKDSEAGKRIYRNTGTPIHPMSPLCKLLWFKDQEPALFSQAAKFVSIKEYIWYRLFGKWLVDHSLASATGLFDIRALEWYGEALTRAGIGPERLSTPVPGTYTETALFPVYRIALGLDDVKKVDGALPFVIGGGDGCLANLGSNAILPGEAALTIGTSGAIRMIAAKPEYDPQERIFNYILTPGLYVSGGAINNGGAVLQWYIDNFCEPSGFATGKSGDSSDATGNSAGASRPGDFSKYIGLAGSVDAGADGLIFLPYLFGERAPIWNADARGLFFGIHSRHTRAHFIRSVIEGICFSLYDVGVSLEETIGPILHINASGGFIKSRRWLQILADIFNRRVYVNNIADASAIGAAITGFLAVGIIDSLDEAKKMIHTLEVFEPDAQQHLVYRRYFGIYKELYARVKDIYGDLRQIEDRLISAHTRHPQ
ncbi:MAG: gluconokinase [Puia sp.]|nr:gluconokinase [Puia sp.]